MDPVKLPYGISNFRQLRRGGYYFVDKSAFIRTLEDDTVSTRYTIFLRPRRFGKSLFVSMLEHYYDLARADEFDDLFHGLAIARQPTPERNRYLVLKFEFTGLALERRGPTLAEDFLDKIRGRVDHFLRKYARWIPEVAATWRTSQLPGQPATLLQYLLDLLADAPYPVYLLIDEYDNFTNELIAGGNERTYYELVQRTGFLKAFFKTVKEGTANGVIGRIFMTGVSPITLDDLTSGANIFSKIALNRHFNDLAGFTDHDVAALVDAVLAASPTPFALDRDALLEDIRRYYDGYLFSPRASHRLYNPDMVLHFLRGLEPPADYPVELLDANIRTDYGRLRSLLFTADDRPRRETIDVVQSLLAEGTLHAQLRDSFPLSDAYHPQYFTSLLFYLGMLTIDGTYRNLLRLVVPNYVVDRMFWETMSRLLEETTGVQVAQDAVTEAVGDMAYDGRLDRFLALVFHRVLRHLSNRDLIRLDERGMKLVLLAYLSLTDLFYPFSEFELNRGYGDLVLTLNRRDPEARFSWILELKYLKESQATQARVAEALDEAEAQLRAYLADERLEAVRGPGGWKAASLVFVGTKALHFRELGGNTGVLTRDEQPGTNPGLP